MNILDELKKETEWYNQQPLKTRKKIEKLGRKLSSEKQLRQYLGKTWKAKHADDVSPIVAAPTLGFILACKQLRRESGLSDLP